MSRQRAVFPFLTIAVAFILIGQTGRSVFLYLGIVFLAIALAGLLFRRR